jgi:DNA-binding response OmpR family regulator
LKILIVDDDPLQASIRKSILERRFTDVIRVADAAEAFCLVEQPQLARSLSLVVTGHHLAGIGGPAFVTELQTRLPGLPVLVLGGLSGEFKRYEGADVNFLPQPFGAEEMLAAAIRLVPLYKRKTA